MKRRTMTAVALVLMLSGCGDGDSGKQPSSNASSGAATVAPAPTPTPTPAPAARSYTYEKAADLTRDRTFTGYDRFSSTSTNGKFTAAQFQSSESAVTSWVKVGSKITFADSSDLPEGGVVSYPNFSVGTGLSIDLNGRLVGLGLPSGMPDYQYFIFSEYRDSNIHRLFVIGSPTDPAELNKSVTLTYRAMIGEELNSGGVKATTVTVDLAKSVVSGTVPLLLSKDNRVNVTLTGTIDATKHIAGTLQSADGKLTGEFRGRPFGPGGKELAVVVAVKQADGALAWTRLTGALQQ